MKAETRQKILKKLKNFDMIEKKIQTEEALGQLMNSEEWQKADTVALFMPFDFEFDLTMLFDVSEKEILIPKTFSKGKMIFCPYDKTQLTRSKFGILEPTNSIEKIPELILVPGLAWNDKGFRIGYGGGFYDRYLADFAGESVSVLYDFQLQEFVAESHDVAVNRLFVGTHSEHFMNSKF